MSTWYHSLILSPICIQSSTKTRFSWCSRLAKRPGVSVFGTRHGPFCDPCKIPIRWYSWLWYTIRGDPESPWQVQLMPLCKKISYVGIHNYVCCTAYICSCTNQKSWIEEGPNFRIGKSPRANGLRIDGKMGCSQCIAGSLCCIIPPPSTKLGAEVILSINQIGFFRNQWDFGGLGICNFGLGKNQCQVTF